MIAYLLNGDGDLALKIIPCGREFCVVDISLV